MRHFRTALLLLVAVAFVATTATAQKPETLVRDEIPESYKWDLTHIYADWDEWQADITKLQELMGELPKYQGRLDEGPEVILEVQRISDELGMTAYKAYSYPSLMLSTDARQQEIQAKLQQVSIMFARFGQSMAWFTPELLQIPEETMREWIAETPELEKYKFGILESYRTAEHTLDAEGEKLLSYFGPATGGGDIYDALATADVEFPDTTLSDGSTMKATHGNYEYSRFSHENQADREALFKAHFTTYDDFENSYASIYNSTLQSSWAYAQARGYSESAEMALDGNNIPVEVMENLINTAKEGSGALQRYMKLRKQAMGLERYRYFDTYRPLVDADVSITYEDVRPMIVKSVEMLGDNYQATVDRAFDERWFDVYENEGKRAGAFSAGVYGVHPYMLLNYGDTYEDAFTLAHEMGHTMHTVLSHEAQPFTTSSYTIFVAEVASTVGEMFFLDHLLETTDKDNTELRVWLLQKVLDNIHTTFYRQAMFADFELKAHRAVRDGQPITAQVLQQLYLESLNDFFGDSLDDKEWYKNTWARISHFQRPFYVYQYATCIAGGTMIYDKMTGADSKKERKMWRDRYLELLSAGGNDHPMSQLQKAGVDWSTPAPAEAMVAKMDELTGQLEKELKKLGKI